MKRKAMARLGLAIVATGLESHQDDPTQHWGRVKQQRKLFEPAIGQLMFI